MDSLTSLMNQNWLGVLVGLAGGAIVSYLFSRWYASRPKLAYRSDSSQFPGRVSFPSPDIEITFRGERVPQVTKSVVSIWNAGNTTIEGAQIVGSDPLRIITSDGSKVLDVAILRVTRNVNRFSAQVRGESNKIELSFDFLDSGDGALVKILHTGEMHLLIAGTTKGLPGGVSQFGVLERPDPRERKRFFRLFVYAYYLFLLLVGIMGPFSVVLGLRRYSESAGNALLVIIVGSLLSILLLLSLGAFMVERLKRPPASLRLREGDW